MLAEETGLGRQRALTSTCCCHQVRDQAPAERHRRDMDVHVAQRRVLQPRHELVVSYQPSTNTLRRIIGTFLTTFLLLLNGTAHRQVSKKWYNFAGGETCAIANPNVAEQANNSAYGDTGKTDPFYVWGT